MLNLNFRAIAKELHGHEIWLYQRAISPGVQEFIEALTFYEYLSGSSESTDWENLQQKLIWSENESETSMEEKFTFPLIPSDFVLGYADLTGKIESFNKNFRD